MFATLSLATGLIMTTPDQQTGFFLRNRSVITGPSTLATTTLIKIFQQFSTFSHLTQATPDRLTFLNELTDGILTYAIENGTSSTSYYDFDFTVRLARTSFNVRFVQYINEIKKHTTFHRFCLAFSRRASQLSIYVEPAWARLFCSASINRNFSFCFSVSHPDIDNLSLGSVLSGLQAEYKRVALVLKDHTKINRLRRDSVTGFTVAEPLSPSRLTAYYQSTIEAMLNLGTT
jgi:hypothetical protein